MASRGKKKTIEKGIIPKNADALKLEALSKENAKIDSIFNICFVVLVLIILILCVVAPIFKTTFTLEIEDIEATQTDFDTSLLDVFIAPIRGINSGFRYVLEGVGVSAKTYSAWKTISSLVSKYIGTDIVETVNTIGVWVYALTICIFASILSMIICALIDRSRGKIRILSTLISTSIFALLVLVLFVAVVYGVVKTESWTLNISSLWGVWLIGFFTAILLAGVIVYSVVHKKALDKQRELKDNMGDTNENL